MATPVSALPTNPLAIELSVHHRRLWWQTTDEDETPEKWDVSADIWRLGVCADEQRHVGKIDFAIADLTGEANLLDSIDLGEWAMEFIGETVLDETGRLVPELEQRITPGPPRLVVLRRVSLSESWRGHGLAGVLIAGALRVMKAQARLAACRISAADFLGHDGGGDDARLMAELDAVRAGAILERIGFWRWRDVHLIDLRNTALIDAGIDIMRRYWPAPNEQ